MRRTLRLLLPCLGGLVLLASIWLWWNRPQQADMAAYVPADSLVYFEANSLPDILEGITSTEAWRTLAPSVGVRVDAGRIGRLSRLAGWTGIGSAASVVFARAQVAVAVLGIDASEGHDLALNISPRLVLIVETHSGESRARSAITQIIDDFARRLYGAPKVETSENDGATFITWTTPSTGKKIVAAISDSVAFIGNDDTAVRTCLAVRRGERASMAADPELAGMRSRIGADAALTFGYVPRGSAPKLAQIAALVLASQSAANSREQSALAIVIPQLAGKLLGGAAWSSKIVDSTVEDRYFFALPTDLTTRLAVAFETSSGRSLRTGGLLPDDVYQFTRYNFSEPGETWRGLNAIISSQLDPTFAPFAGGFLEKSLSVFGIDSPREFLRTVGPEIATARLDESGAGLVFVADVRDETALRGLLRKRSGGAAQVVRVGDAEAWVSRDPEVGAASVIDGQVVLGDEASVRRCLEARASRKNVAASGAFKKWGEFASDTPPPLVLTYTRDDEQARRFISLIARRSTHRRNAPDANALALALAAQPYAVSATRLAVDGLERTTRSSFGQLGAIAIQSASEPGEQK